MKKISFLAIFAWFSSQISANPNLAGLLHFQFKDGQNGADQTTTDSHGSSVTFAVGQMSLFLDADITEKMYLSSEIETSLFNTQPEQTPMSLRTVSATFTNLQKWKTNLQVGRFDSVFGSFVSRRLPIDNPLFDAPLAYSHKVNLNPEGGWVSPVAVATQSTVRELSLVSRKLTQTGIKLFGDVKKTKLSYAFSLTNNPASNPKDVDLNDSIAVNGSLQWIFDQKTRFGISLSSGSWMNSLNSYNLNPVLYTRAAGKSTHIQDYSQNLIGANFDYKSEKIEFHAEYISSSFEVPNLASNLDSQSAYLEGKYHFTKNFFSAARYDTLSFDNTKFNAGGGIAPAKWDNDITRYQVGLGNFINADTLAKITWQNSDYDLPGTLGDFSLLSGSLSVLF